jgi:hypothetical protein
MEGLYDSRIADVYTCASVSNEFHCRKGILKPESPYVDRVL